MAEQSLYPPALLPMQRWLHGTIQPIRPPHVVSLRSSLWKVVWLSSLVLSGPGTLHEPDYKVGKLWTLAFLLSQRVSLVMHIPRVPPFLLCTLHSMDTT